MNLKYTYSRPGTHQSPETPTVFVVDGDAAVRDELELLDRELGTTATAVQLALPRAAHSAAEIAAAMRSRMTSTFLN